MNTLQWFERQFTFGLPSGMLPFYLERLEGTIVRIETKVANISEEMLATQLNNKWSIKQNIGHLAEVDGIALQRIAEIIKGVSPMSPAVFEPRGDYNAQPVEEVINFFRENRKKNLNAYYNLAEKDLLKSSLHPRLKVQMTPVDLAWFDAEHDDHHLVKINEIVNALTK
jgi:uncharacterized damage-inducible protein DinB